MTEFLPTDSAVHPSEPEGEMRELTSAATSPQDPGGNHAAALRRLLAEALRVSICLKPRWQGLPASPWLIALLVLLYLAAI